MRAGEFWTRRRYGELNLLLWAVWNPIASGVPLDEFESYVPRIAGALGLGVEAVAGELGAIRTEWLEGEPDLERDRAVADLIIDRYEQSLGASE